MDKNSTLSDVFVLREYNFDGTGNPLELVAFSDC